MSEKILRAGMWDQMHYILRRYNDRMTHICLEYQGHIDADSFAKAVRYMTDRVTVLHSSFQPSPIRPFWRVCDYETSDILTVSETDTPNEDAYEFLLREIPCSGKVQINIGLFRRGEQNVLAVMTNHMCMDAGDTVYFLRTLFAEYDAIVSGGEDVPVRSGSREHTRVYADMPKKQRLHAHMLWRYRGKIRNSPLFPYQPTSGSDRKAIVRRTIDGETVGRIGAYAKQHGATTNDVLSAAAMTVLYEMCAHPENKPLSLSCAINLRRHMADGGKSTGLTNHVAWFSCKVDRRYEFEKLLDAVRQSMEQSKNDPYVGLYTLPLLNLGCTVVPFFLTEPIARRVYNNPPLGMSNVGRFTSDALPLHGAQLLGGYTAGTFKNKPSFLITATRFDRYICLSSAIYGSDEDVKTAESFFTRMEEILILISD